MSQILTNNTSQVDKIKTAIIKFEQKHKAFLESGGFFRDLQPKEHFKVIREGNTATLVEINAFASLLKIPII